MDRETEDEYINVCRHVMMNHVACHLKMMRSWWLYVPKERVRPVWMCVGSVHTNAALCCLSHEQQSESNVSVEKQHAFIHSRHLYVSLCVRASSWEQVVCVLFVASGCFLGEDHMETSGWVLHARHEHRVSVLGITLCSRKLQSTSGEEMLFPLCKAWHCIWPAIDAEPILGVVQWSNCVCRKLLLAKQH